LIDMTQQTPPPDPKNEQPMQFQPGHVMQREHYERLAREAAQESK